MHEVDPQEESRKRAVDHSKNRILRELLPTYTGQKTTQLDLQITFQGMIFFGLPKLGNFSSPIY